MDLLEVGKIVNTHGLRGEVKVVPWTDYPEVFEDIDFVYVKKKSEYERLDVKGIKYQKNNLIVRFSQITDINMAEKYKNQVIYAEREILGELPEGVYYIADLIGLDIVTEDGEKIGTVSDVFNTGSNDIYEVKREGKKNLLLPVIDDVVLNIDVLTLFPQMFEAVLGDSIIGRARENNILEMNFIDIRDFSTNKHRKVDDYPYSGGGGMLMNAQPVYDAYMSVAEGLDYKPFTIYMSPQGKVFNQGIAIDLANYEHIVLLCGHYEGIDQRVIDEIVDMELSVGDFVMTGGEIPAMTVIDTVSRLVPGVLAAETSYENESHFNGLLEYPQYTRPAVWHDKSIPDVLISGHHAKIEQWKREQSLINTLKKRPDMLEKAELTKEDINFLKEYK